jgi:hypothetical protein
VQAVYALLHAFEGQFWRCEQKVDGKLQDLEKPLSDYGITSATRILVLKHADNAVKRAMDAASERDIRMKRLRQCSNSLWLSFVQLPNN